MPVETIAAPLRNKVAVITGGSRGIGRATAIEFARQGCSHIAISHRSSDPSEALALIKGVSSDIVTCAVKADVDDDNFGATVIAESLKGLGVDHIDIVVQNATLLDADAFVPAAQIDKAKFDFYMRTNAWSSFQLAMSAIPHIKNAGGRIIFISSGGSKMAFGDPLMGHCFGKAAMDSISNNLAMTYGSSGKMTINTIGVGVTDTDALRGGEERMPGHRKMGESMSPLNRAADPEEVAQIVAFVASPAASWINGNQVPANGGMLRVLQS